MNVIKSLLSFAVIAAALAGSQATAKDLERQADIDTVATWSYTHRSTRYGVSIGSGMNSVAAANVSQRLQANASAGVYAQWSSWLLSMESGLLWHYRSFDLTGMNPLYTSVRRAKTSLNYLEVPLKFGVRLMLTFTADKPKIYVTPHFGLYAACAVDRHTDGFRRFDFGGKLGLSVEVDRWRFNFDYTRGWVDINRRIDRHVKTKSFDFAVGYAFFSK